MIPKTGIKLHIGKILMGPCMHARVASRIRKRLKTEDLIRLGNVKKVSKPNVDLVPSPLSMNKS